jgi:hypothetical protein
MLASSQSSPSENIFDTADWTSGVSFRKANSVYESATERRYACTCGGGSVRSVWTTPLKSPTASPFRSPTLSPVVIAMATNSRTSSLFGGGTRPLETAATKASPRARK